MPDQATAVGDKSQNQSHKFKIKVSGQEKEVELTDEQIIEAIQKSEDYTLKTQELADKKKAIEIKEQEVTSLKKIIDEMQANPDLEKQLNKVYSDFKSGKISKSDEAKDRSLKKLDKLIEDATNGDQREQLRDIRTIIKEETGDVATLMDEIKSLKTELSNLKSASLIGINDRIDRDIKSLEEEFGKDLVDKYRKDIKDMATKYPQNSISKIFKYVCDDDEYRKAVVESEKKKEKEELERKKKGSSPSGTSSLAAKTELKKGAGGRVEHSSLIARIRERMG